MFIGLAFVGFSAVVLFLMHVSQTIPFHEGTHRQERPELYRRFQLVYLAVGIIGAVIAIVGWYRS